MHKYGHWHAPWEFDPEEWYGFIYRVTNKENGMQYIGRKFFFSRTRKKVKGRKNRKVIMKESDWRTYTTSSKRINAEILERGKEIFEFEIIELCKTRGDLTYREAETQWAEKVLEAQLPDGSRKYYNNAIGGVRFQLSVHREATRKKIQEKLTGNKNAAGAVRSPETREKMSKAKTGRVLSDETKEKIRTD